MNPTHPVCQPFGTSALSQCWSCPCPHIPLLNLGQREDPKKVSAEGDLLFCSCRTSKTQWRTGRWGRLPPASTALHPLSADGHCSSSSAHVGRKTPPHHPLPWGASPSHRQRPGKPAKLQAPALSAGCERAYVRSQESWRGWKGVNSFKIVLDAWCISIYTMCFTFLPTGFSWCSVCRRRPCCEF